VRQGLGQSAQVWIKGTYFERLEQKRLRQSEARPARCAVQESLGCPDGWCGFKKTPDALEEVDIHVVLLFL
jgi:hypothetical protein